MSEEPEFDPLIHLLPDGYISLGFVASVKALDADGDVVLHHLRSSEIPTWEAAGMLISALDDARATLRGLGVDQDDDD